ncbi:MAG TPA: DUF2784 domain-containing protein [Planctomycetes bacterium]|nr:DUF2784 domain-containing protein [Planctomycetota bacterium]
MIYRVLADTVLILHALYASVVVFGLIAILIGVWRRWQWVRNFWFRLIHFLMIFVVAVLSLLGWPCPLTDLERSLRDAAGQATYAGAFIEHWVGELLFYDFPTWVFAVTYCLFGLAVLGTLLLAPPRWPWSRSPSR